MKKNIITAIGLIALVVLSYVGIAQLKSAKSDIIHESETLEMDEGNEVDPSQEKKKWKP